VDVAPGVAPFAGSGCFVSRGGRRNWWSNRKITSQRNLTPGAMPGKPAVAIGSGYKRMWPRKGGAFTRMEPAPVVVP